GIHIDAGTAPVGMYQASALDFPTAMNSRNLTAGMNLNVMPGANAAGKILAHPRTELRPANNHVNGFGAILSQKHRSLPRGIPRAHNGNILSLMQKRLHRGAGIIDTRSLERLGPGNFQLPPAHPRGNENDLRPHRRAAAQM